MKKQTTNINVKNIYEIEINLQVYALGNGKAFFFEITPLNKIDVI